MGVKIREDVAGRVFPTRKALIEHIQKVLDYKNRRAGESFYDEVLAHLVHDRHYRLQGNMPEAFAFIPNQPGDGRASRTSLAAWMGGEWRRFSYRRCFSDDPFADKFSQACRERFTSRWRSEFLEPLCSCGAATTDVDHVRPQHRDVVAQCVAALTPADREAMWLRMLDGSQHFRLLEGEFVAVLYDALTRFGTFQSLCKACHHEATSRRLHADDPADKI